jgi:hypothetical protein
LSLFGSYLHDDSFKQHKLKDSDYTIKAIKGYLDACNLTDFTPAISAISEHKPLLKPIYSMRVASYSRPHTTMELLSKASAIRPPGSLYIVNGEKLQLMTIIFDKGTC